MGWLDHQEKHEKGGKAVSEVKSDKIEVMLPGCGEYVRINKNQIHRIYLDEQPRLMLVIDEVAELLMPTGVKTEAGKEEDQMKQECVGLIQSITQLGRSAGIHVVCCTQRNDTKIIPGVIQNNPISGNSVIKVLRGHKLK